MYNTTALIPARFLTLIAHFCVCILLLWSPQQSVKACVPSMASEEVFNSYHSQLVTGLSLSLTMIVLELLSFIVGITMFNTTSALMSIGGHVAACTLLCYFVLDNWQCGWFWWIFAFGSCLPMLNDIFIVTDVLINKKY